MRSKFELTTFGFPDLPEREADALLIQTGVYYSVIYLPTYSLNTVVMGKTTTKTDNLYSDGYSTYISLVHFHVCPTGEYVG